MRLIVNSVVRTLRSPINKNSGSVKGFLAVIIIITLFLFSISNFGIGTLFEKWANGSFWVPPNVSTAPRNTSLKIDLRPAFENVSTSTDADLKTTVTTTVKAHRSTSTSKRGTRTTTRTTTSTTIKTTTEKPIRLSKIHYKKTGKNHPKAVPKVSFFKDSEIGKLKAKPQKKSAAVSRKSQPKIQKKAHGKSKFNPDTIFHDVHLLKLAQNDTKLVAFIRQHYLTPPSKMPYKLMSTKSDAHSTKGNKEIEWKIVLGLLDNKKNGFFIECGANDYEINSNTLSLERDHGWTGLLVEPDPINLPELYEKHRKAWIANTCLSGELYPEVVTMRRGGWNKTAQGKVQNNKNNLSGQNTFNASCLPLFSILSAIGTTQVDFFRLDVGMIGLDILKTLPFESVSIKVLAVGMSDAFKSIEIPFVESKGYVCLQRIRAPRINDYIFIQRTLYKKSMGQHCYENMDSKAPKKGGKVQKRH